MKIESDHGKASSIAPIRLGVWSLGVVSWLFGITERSQSAWADGVISASDLVLLFTAIFFFACWLFLFPTGGDRT